MTASVSRPASTDSMISACPGRSSRILKTSRIFSRARRSAGEGGGGGASGVITGAAAEIDAGSGSSSSRGPEPSRRITIVGTPSSPVTRNRRPRVGAAGGSAGESSKGDPTRGGSKAVAESLSGPSAAAIAAPARESSSELRLYSCKNHERGADTVFANPPNPIAPCHEKTVVAARLGGRQNNLDPLPLQIGRRGKKSAKHERELKTSTPSRISQRKFVPPVKRGPTGVSRAFQACLDRVARALRRGAP